MTPEEVKAIEHEATLSRRYRLIEKLGAGGMGAVYRAADALTGNFVALKRVIAPADALLFNSRSAHHSATDPATALALALAHEFRMLASLRHPNVINVLDYGFDDGGKPYYTMELLEKPRTILEASLDQKLYGQLNLLAQTLRALSYLHRRGLIHRDLKPGNILVTGDGQVKLLDFGLSIMADRAHGGSAGTLYYMAPELLQGGAASPESDLYALGVVAYELLAGRHPYPYETMTRLIDAILYEPIDLMPLEMRPDLPSALIALVDRLLNKTPDLRYNAAENVLAALEQIAERPLAGETLEIRDSFTRAAQFVGRDAEMARLMEALDSALAGHGGLWLVGGESGVGKSRLTDEMRAVALVRGVLLLRGHAAAERGLSYPAWREALPQLILESDVSEIEAGILAEIVPNIHQLTGRTVAPMPAVDGQAGRTRLIHAIVALFQRYKRPVMVILEDLQWADDDLDPLKRLADLASERSWLIIGTYRDDERPDLPEKFAGQPLQNLKLQRLDDKAMAALSKAMLGGERPEVLDLLRHETEGNAFFLVEVVRTLAEEAGKLAEIGRQTLPAQVFAGGVARVLARRIERVLAQGLLELAAVAGRVLDTGVLRYAASNYHYLPDGLTFDHWLNVAVNAAVLEWRDGHYQFAHDKMREFLLDQLAPTIRVPLHAHLAAAIESVYAGQLDERAATLARLYENAGESEKELYYRKLAGGHALRLGMVGEAARHLERARVLSQGEDDVLYQLARAYYQQGSVAESRTLLEAVIAQAEAAGNHSLHALALVEMGYVMNQLGDIPTSEALARKARRAFARWGNRWGLVQALRLSGRIAQAQHQYARVGMYIAEALEVVRADKMDHVMPSLLISFARCENDQGEFDAAQSHAEQARAMYEAQGDQAGIADVYNELGVICGRRDDDEASREYYRRAMEVNRQLGQKSGAVVALLNSGIATKKLGQKRGDAALYHEAAAIYRECIEVFTAMGWKLGISTSHVNLANVLELLGEDVKAQKMLRIGIRHAKDAQVIGVMTGALLAMVRIAKKNGTPQALTRAVEYCIVMTTHPSATVNIRKDATALLEEIKASMPVTEYDKAVSEARTLDVVIAEIIDEPVHDTLGD
jgi:tetratricopeptide (TPR) repeat protein